jgi:putative ATP-dependent endonuclease of the OLD family
MYISHVHILNFRALQSVDIPLNQFSVLLGENDVGKTSFLYALDAFFLSKKINDIDNFFKRDTSKNISIYLQFMNTPNIPELESIKRQDGSILVSKDFPYDKAPIIKAILDDGSKCDIDKKVLKDWFSSDNFHFIPVRRDLAVQFSMNKTALLGKTLRAKMKSVIERGDASESLQQIQDTIKASLQEPQEDLEAFLQEQLHNLAIKLNFKDIEVDPVEGVSFNLRLSDDRVEDILIQNRGAGTQNNLIIALFRLIAKMHVGEYFIFAMEEPENSLHPKAQRQLLAVIQDISHQSQVIVTTHSPIFLERSKFENNIILTRTVKGNTIAKTFNPELLSDLRADLGIRPSDALLKGGGNCALLVEGNTEEEGFPVFMEMHGLSEFQLGIAIINMRGSDKDKVRNTVRLLLAYDIPCIIVLDSDATKTEEDIGRESQHSLTNIKKIFRLSKGTIEDYYPLEIVAEVINQELSPATPVTTDDFDKSKHGDERLRDFRKVMHEHGAGSSIGYLKRFLGGIGTKMMREKGMPLDPEIQSIFNEVKKVVEEQ